MIDHEHETLIGFAEAARKLPKSPSGRAVHAKTVARWAVNGLRGIRLESLCVGGRRVTSVEACRRFFEALTRAGGSTNPRQPASEETKRRLRDRGLL